MSDCRCRNGWICEEHPWSPWPHDACAGPGMQCDDPTCPHWASERPFATRFDDWPPPPLEPKMFREVAWRLVGPSNKVITCAIVLINTGYEVRVGYSDDDIIRTVLTPDLDTARTLAADIRSVAEGSGSFADLDRPT